MSSTCTTPRSARVLRPGAAAGGVLCEHYPDFATLRKRLAGDEIYLPTELLHGLYDGGLGAGLHDFWNLMVRSPLSAGGFLWAFTDEAVKRTDRDGVLDAAGNLAPDGILGPHREKEGSFFTVKEIWSPIQVEAPRLDEGFDGRLAVENRYQFTNAERCALPLEARQVQGALGRAARPRRRPRGGRGRALDRARGEGHAGSAAAVRVEGERRALPHGEGPGGARALHVDVDDQEAGPGPRRPRRAGGRRGAVRAATRGTRSSCRPGASRCRSARRSGRWPSVRAGGRTISLGGGPVVAGKNVAGWLRELTHGPEGDAYVVRARFGGNLQHLTWRMEPSGWLRLDYRFWLPDRDGHADHDYYGVTFDYPEAQVTGVRWLGRGPYRVWKNRTRGTTFDVWQKAYNRTETGVSWDYPEFKGYHGNLYWAVIQNREKDFVVATETDDLFLRLFTPQFVNAGSALAAFPPGDISFLHGIAPIGMKFASAGSLGPESQRRLAVGTFSGTLFFYFGDPPRPERGRDRTRLTGPGRGLSLAFVDGRSHETCA